MVCGSSTSQKSPRCRSVSGGAPHCMPNSWNVPTNAGRSLRFQVATSRLRKVARPME